MTGDRVAGRVTDGDPVARAQEQLPQVLAGAEQALVRADRGPVLMPATLRGGADAPRKVVIFAVCRRGNTTHRKQWRGRDATSVVVSGTRTRLSFMGRSSTLSHYRLQETHRP